MAVYAIPFDNLTVTNDSDQDIIEITAPSDAAVKIHRIVLNSATTTDERVRLRLVRRSTNGSGGSAATEVPIDGTAAAVGTAGVTLVTTPGTIGAIMDTDAELHAQMYVAASNFTFERITSAYTAGAGYVHLVGTLLRNAGA